MTRGRTAKYLLTYILHSLLFLFAVVISVIAHQLPHRKCFVMLPAARKAEEETADGPVPCEISPTARLPTGALDLAVNNLNLTLEKAVCL